MKITLEGTLPQIAQAMQQFVNPQEGEEDAVQPLDAAIRSNLRETNKRAAGDSSEDTPKEKEGPKRGRRGSVGDDAEEAEEKPKRRRSRRKAKEPEVEDDDDDDDDLKPEKKTRRESRKKLDSEPEEEAGSSVTDVDLSKAASEAGSILGVKAVKDILEQFGVGHVNDIEGDERQEFLDMVNAALEEDEDD